LRDGAIDITVVGLPKIPHCTKTLDLQQEVHLGQGKGKFLCL